MHDLRHQRDPSEKMNAEFAECESYNPLSAASALDLFLFM